MNTTQKWITIGLCAAMLAGSAALAEEDATTSATVSSGTKQQQTQEQNQQGPSSQMPGMNRQNRHGQQMPSGNQNGGRRNGQMPGMNGQMPENRQTQQAQPPEMPSGNPNSDLQNGQLPQIPDMNGQLPDNGQAQQVQPPEMPSSSDTENDTTAVVQTGNSGKLKMRRGPSHGSRIDSYLKNGTEVEVLEVRDGWVKIRVNGKEGYVMVEFLEMNLQTQEADPGSSQESESSVTPETNG